MNTLYVTREELHTLREISSACVRLSPDSFDEARWEREVTQLLGIPVGYLRGDYRVEVVDRIVDRLGVNPGRKI